MVRWYQFYQSRDDIIIVTIEHSEQNIKLEVTIKQFSLLCYDSYFRSKIQTHWTQYNVQTLCQPYWMFWAGQKTVSGTKKRYQGDISFFVPCYQPAAKAQLLSIYYLLFACLLCIIKFLEKQPITIHHIIHLMIDIFSKSGFFLVFRLVVPVRKKR